MQRNRWKNGRGWLVALMAGMFLVLFPGFTSQTAHAASNGKISGQLINGSQKGSPVAKQTVTLQMAQGEDAQDLTTTTTDEKGAFSFENLATEKTIRYAVYVRFQGAHYTSDLLSLAEKPEQQVQMKVYEATTDASNIAVVQVTVLFHEPDVKKGTITVSEIFTFKNLDLRSFVGSLDGSQGKPRALLFSLPPGAKSIALKKGFDGYQVIQVDRGFASSAALLPGDSQFAFTFEIPYQTATYDFPYVAMYPTVDLSVMVPPSMRASSGVLTSDGIVTAGESTYHVFKANGLTPGNEIHVKLEGLPTPASATASAPLSMNTIWLIVGGILMVAIIGVTWVFYRARTRKPGINQRSSVTAKATGATKSQKERAETPKQTAEERQQALLKALLDLDKAHEAGKVSKAAYQERRARIKARLRTVMSEQEAAKR